MQTTSWIEISKSALANNISFIEKLVGDKTRFSSVVKGNAYGHGIEVFCPLAYELGVRHFSTFDAHEAYRVINAVGNKDFELMIMGAVTNDQLEWVIDNGIEFFVFNYDRLESVINVAKKLNRKARIHLEFETGMNRTGFSTRSINTIYKVLLEYKDYIELKGICSHLAGAENIANYKRVQDQSKRFKKIKHTVESWSEFSPIYHLTCSAGTLRYPNYLFDLARIGILQYGFFPSTEVHIQFITKNKVAMNPLQRIITWKTRVMEVKKVKVGEFVGYGTSFFCNSPKTIVAIPVGYSSGYARALSNSGKVLIRGKRLDVIGTVNMNMVIADATELDNVEIGDEVVLIGYQGNAEITVGSFSDYSQQVNYELLTRLPINIDRTIVA